MPAAILAIWTTISGLLALKRFGKRVHMRARLFERHARSETREDIQKIRTTTARILNFAIVQRHPNISRFGPRKTRMWKLKTVRHYADHGVALTVERDASIDDAAIGTEASLPERIAQNNGVRFITSEQPPE
jgi:hypothetical protein